MDNMMSGTEAAKYVGLDYGRFGYLVRTHRDPKGIVAGAKLRLYKRDDLDAWMKERGHDNG